MTILDAFEDSDFVISPSGSCTGMIHHYPKLFENDPSMLDRALALAGTAAEATHIRMEIDRLDLA